MSLKVLFVHQNFPGQFRYLLAFLSQDTRHELVAMGYGDHKPSGRYRYVQCVPKRGNGQDTHPWVIDLESKVIRGQTTAEAALALRQDGFYPDVIVGHPGWGECLFLKDVWPRARLGLYCEFFYRAEGQDVGFDAEFGSTSLEATAMQLRLKNASSLLSLEMADACYSPTHWQATQFPREYREKIDVIHDGVDSGYFAPNPEASIHLNGSVLSRHSRVITFVARHLEPHRGIHTFMRALPEILKNDPDCRVVIVGDSGPGYGPPPAQGTWLDLTLSEVGARLDPARVHVVGSVPLEVFRVLMQVSAVHVYLTYPFVLSWSLLQAMSCGALIVASRTPPVLEVIEEGRNGHLIDFFSPSELAAEVLRALASPLDSEVRRGARETVLERFDLQSVCLPRQREWLERLSAR